MRACVCVCVLQGEGARGVRAYNLYRDKFTSQPVPGVGPSQFGGGPPYFLCPVVTSKGYPVLSRIN
ncbi:hypothetical protein ALC57_10297 [Trachymyrmex cornetzi]|uniref:Uncharacterized protein n=1 Tax=Trachymyrmex cornetzi TaxID=471704 RepID=A0A151J4D9_9HYME|nr:hypothetical protein ALC57_10297 [Trachymyrmex cornetzi]